VPSPALSTNSPQSRPPRGRTKPRHQQRAKAERPAAVVADHVSPAPTGPMPSFAELGLPADLITALHRRGIEAPFPIQAATMPDVLAGRDVLGRGQTGSGKTLAFGLPLLARLAGRPTAPKSPRGLVLVPTRELAMQVHDALEPFAHALGLEVRTVVGGTSFGKQVDALRRGADVVVATPGRLVDLIEQRACVLSAVEITALDEADHMSDMGFLPVVRRLLDQVKPGGQRLLFSATLDNEVATIVRNYLVDPVTHSIAPPSASVTTMEHHVLHITAAEKVGVVADLAGREGRTLFFVRTKHGADRLAKQLRSVGVSAGALHGGKAQNARTRALDRFRDGTMPVLVATDVAARGIHVDDVSLVVHVDPPADPKDYLHRAGRTARAGESGKVVTLVMPTQRREVDEMTKRAGIVQQGVKTWPGDQTLTTLFGAKAPSGVAVADPSAGAPEPARGTPRPRRPRSTPQRSAGVSSRSATAHRPGRGSAHRSGR
jgi:superfamily II DNA/RNA helicase